MGTTASVPLQVGMHFYSNFSVIYAQAASRKKNECQIHVQFGTYFFAFLMFAIGNGTR
jgi:hypothetical protein